MATAIKLTSNISYDYIDDKNVYFLIDKIRDGLTYSQFNNIANKTGFAMQDWAKFLNVSLRTLQRHKEEKRKLDAVKSERIIQISLLFNLGEEVFGNAKSFTIWLETSNLALGNIAPKNLLDSAFGINILKAEIHKIEHGIPA